jgi:ADP-ribosylglycohydrolase
MNLSMEPEVRLTNARAALEGLSVGDAFGDLFFHPEAEERLRKRELPPGEWPWTDDTQMALSIFRELQHGTISQDRLAMSFAMHYEPGRGYGPSMHGQLRSVREGLPWRQASQGQFGGTGSFGNGAAMRIAPLGAYFANDFAAVVENAVRASEVTHAHPEGIAGGIAVAIAAAVAVRLHGNPPPSRAEFIEAVLPHVPEGEVHTNILRARDLKPGTPPVSAQDTVGFCLYCAGEWLSDYEEAMWQTVGGFGDRDTTCAIVGGIVAAYTGIEGIPSVWRAARETLSGWAFVAGNVASGSS